MEAITLTWTKSEKQVKQVSILICLNVSPISTEVFKRKCYRRRYNNNGKNTDHLQKGLPSERMILLVYWEIQ